MIYFVAALFAISIGLYFYVIRIKKIDKKSLLYGLPTAINTVACYFIAREVITAFIQQGQTQYQIIATAMLQVALAFGVLKIAELLFSAPTADPVEKL